MFIIIVGFILEVGSPGKRVLPISECHLLWNVDRKVEKQSHAPMHFSRDLTVSKRPETSCRIEIHLAVFNHLYLLLYILYLISHIYIRSGPDFVRYYLKQMWFSVKKAVLVCQRTDHTTTLMKKKHTKIIRKAIDIK